MNTILKLMSVACTGAMLLACGHAGVRPEVAVHKAAVADDVYLLARQQHLARHYEAALQGYQSALAADPMHMNARNGMATLYAETGEYDKAIALWQKAINELGVNVGAESAYLFRNLGYAFFLNGEYASAQMALERACILDPLNPRAWEHLGGVYGKQGQDERARQVLHQAQTLREHDLRADAASQPVVPAAVREAPPATSARAEIVDIGAGMVELRRVEAGRAAAPASQARLEIANGNGVTGMAASLARARLHPGLRVVRLSNEKGFNVRQTRVEYRAPFGAVARGLGRQFPSAAVVEVKGAGPTDLRLVIGHDLVYRATAMAERAGQM